MEFSENLLQHQVQILAQAVNSCQAARRDLLDIQIRLSNDAEFRAQRLQEIQQQQDVQLQLELQQLEVGAEQERDTLQLDLLSQTESFLAQKEQAQEQQISNINDEIERLTEKEMNELWVLQSVLDDNAADSPTDELDREKESVRNQKLAIEERAQVLDHQIRSTQEFLNECHTSAGTAELPPESCSDAVRDLTDLIREEGDRLLAQAGDLEGKSLPQWVRGSRLWVLSLAIVLLVFFPVLLIKVGPGTLLNPDIAPPNWQWVMVSAMCGFAAAVCIAAVIVTIVQSWLRRGFRNMLQSASNAQHMADLWQERSALRLGKMERAAEKWRRKVTKQREQKTAQIRARFDRQKAVLEQQIAMVKQNTQDETAAHEDRLQRQKTAELQRIDQAQQNNRHRVEQTSSDRIKKLQASCISEFDRKSQSEHVVAQQRIDEWNRQLQEVRCLTQDSVQTGAVVHHWAASSGTNWSAPQEMPAVMSPGELLVTLPKPPDSTVQSPTTNLCVEMPAVLSFPQDTSIVVEHDATGRTTALSFLRTQVLRLLTLIPPGRVRLTLLDPIGLGQSFSAMMHLADYDELLIHSRIWTDESQLRNQLRKTTEHMENVFQTYLRSEFSTIEEYNESAGEVAEPYHFVVIAGFPQAFSEESGRYLSSILTSGPRCGVHTLIAWNPGLMCPPGFDVGELKASCIQFRVRNQTVVPAMDLPRALRFEATPEPAAADYVRIVKTVGEKSKNARRVEVSFRRVAPRDDAVWSQSTAEGIDLPIGRAGAARLQFMRLGRGTSQHVLVAGKTGSGKSTFLHIVITNLALHYSPAEIQFYLIDFKKGVEFRTYATNRMPHVRVVAIESDREFGLSVLERLDTVLQERGELFRSRGVQDVPAFRTQFPDEPLPRLLLLIDEFQEFFVAEDRVAGRASLLLDRLVRQGRAFGIHVLLGSQTLGGAYSLSRSTLGQVAVRVALQCSESDAHLILSEDNSAARLLTRPGEAIYNDANGLTEGNHPFQIAWLEEETREDLIRRLKDRPDHPPAESSMIVFEGNVAPTVEQCGTCKPPEPQPK